MFLNPIRVFTDGGAINSDPFIGAWAFAIRKPGWEGFESMSGTFYGTTNNRMELRAILYALRQLQPDEHAIICSDSMYAINGITKWRKGWEAKNWMKADGQPVLNADLWKKLYAIVDQRKVDFMWVKGHSGVAGNEFVDKLCSKTMSRALRTRTLAQLDKGAGLVA